MGAFFDELSPSLIEWVKEQKIFFVATAPNSSKHHVNVSPKGHDTFHIVSPTSCWYLDLTGSGNETISHLEQNGRITILFQAFVGPPRIVRLFGYGKVLERSTPEFKALHPPGDLLPGTRSIIWIDIHKVGTSCGFSVPYFDYKEERPTLLNWARTREKEDLLALSSSSTTTTPSTKGLQAYWTEKNSLSMDGLAGYRIGGKRRRFAKLRDARWMKEWEKGGFWFGLLFGVMIVLLVQRVEKGEVGKLVHAAGWRVQEMHSWIGSKIGEVKGR
ncbi:hypothetical protein T439DRAFT_326000 [Meredithblackwellia eburnea MCA 4105]